MYNIHTPHPQPLHHALSMAPKKKQPTAIDFYKKLTAAQKKEAAAKTRADKAKARADKANAKAKAAQQAVEEAQLLHKKAKLECAVYCRKQQNIAAKNAVVCAKKYSELQSQLHDRNLASPERALLLSEMTNWEATLKANLGHCEKAGFYSRRLAQL
jgi:hypothetical protein